VTFDDEVLVVRRSKLVLATAAAPVVAGGALVCTWQPSVVALGLSLAWLGVGWVLYTLARNPAAAARPVQAHADARGLFLDGAPVLASAGLSGGWLEPRANAPPMVKLRARRGRELELVVRDAERGRALLRALDVDPVRVSATYWTMARPLGEPRAFARAATVLALVLALGIVAAQTTPGALALAVVALLVLFAGVTVPTHVCVGADGVLLRWLGTVRFVAWSSVAAIETFDGGVVLALDPRVGKTETGAHTGGENGRWLTLRVPAEHERHHPERDAMVERMRSAWRAHGSQATLHAEQTAARLVGRAGGRTREWVRAMRSVVTPPADYRTASIPTERLWRLVEDPRVDRLARTGAAIALARGLDEAGRHRLAAAASSCAEPRLRVALATAASDTGAASDEELAAALDAIESEGEDEGSDQVRIR
jgi:hypothetical protein